MLKERKIALSLVLAMLLLVMMLPFNVFDNTGVYAIPSEPPPPPPQPPEHHPHWTPGLASFIPGTGTVTWARNWANCVLNPNNVAHQHYDEDEIHSSNRSGIPSPQPYSAYACWDNLRFRVDDVGVFDRGHGFINEYPQLGGGDDQIPRYRFEANVPAQARNIIKEVFTMVGSIASDKSHLIVGLAFREVAETEPAGIMFRWQNISDLGETAPTEHPPAPFWDQDDGTPVNVTFDSSRSWSFSFNPAFVGVGEWHFTSVVIHEIGHLVGLDEQNDIDDVMYYLSGLYGFIYLDADGDGVVSAGDRRLCGYNGFVDTPTGTSYNVTLQTNVMAGDEDLGTALMIFDPNMKHDEFLPANGAYDSGEYVYVDNDLSDSVSVGDRRLDFVRAGGATYEGGSIVALGDNDIGGVLVAFSSNECNTGAGPWFPTGPLDPPSQWFYALDMESIHGVRVLYSIPQYDFGDAPDNYPAKFANNGAYALVIDKEWLGRPTSRTTLEREPRQVDRDWPDDGVEFMLGGTGGQVKVTVSVFDHLSQRYQGTYKLYVAVWMDFSFDQDWKTSNNELILWTRIDPLTEMQGNTYTTSWVPFSYPGNFLELLLFYGKTWARARLVYADTGGTLTSDQGDEGLLPPIESPDNGGEIEDYIVYPSWPMFRHDPRHTGNSISTAPGKKGVLWNYTTAGSVRSSPAVVDGRLFVGSDDCRVYALNATTGSLIWDYVTPQPVPSSPAVAFGMVFANSLNQSTYALDANTGALIWIQSFGVYGAIGELSPTVAYGKVFVALGYHLDVAAVNAMTGELVWASNFTGGATSSPAAADGMVFIGADSGRVYALNAETGTHVWNYTTGGAVCSSPTISNDRVFAGSYDGNICALNATTGVLSWSYPTGNPIDSSPAVADDRLLIGSGNDVYALNATTGTLLWKYSTGGTVKSSPAIADDKVFIGSYDYRIYALNLTSGAVIWSYNGGNEVESSPAVAESKVFVGIGNKVYAFGPYYHNIAIEQVTITKSVVGQGFSLSMNVTVQNQGNFTETFNLTALANMTSIALQPLILTSGNSATIPFSWNTSGFAYGNYTMGAYTTLLQDETDWTDNIYTDGTVAVTIPGDVNGDFQVKPYDLALLIASYGSDPYPPNPRPWNPVADINGDDKVGPYDLALLITHYGQHYP